MRHLEQIRQHRDGLLRLQRIHKHIRPLRQRPNQVDRMAALIQPLQIRRQQLRRINSRAARDTAQSGMGILQVRARVALEARHAVHVKVVAIDALAGHILHHDGRNAEGIRRLLRVLDLFVLCLVRLHDLVHLVADVAQDVVEEFRGALARRHTRDHAEIDVLAARGDVRAAHEFFDFEELLQVQVLLGSDDVDHLVKVVFVEAFCGGADVARQVETRAVFLHHRRFAEFLAVRRQVDDDGAFVDGTDALVGHDLGRSFHAGFFDLRLARVVVVADVEPGVCFLHFVDGEVAEAFPHSKSAGVAVDHAFEVATGFFVGGGVNVCVEFGL